MLKTLGIASLQCLFESWTCNSCTMPVDNGRNGDPDYVIDEPYPSLSDFHDYEPNLEFDDTELDPKCFANDQPVEGMFCSCFRIC